ncbi:hypothetical protein [Streptomyces umbrinus]|uniref:hypothetical protein n=1 Tax=Streptomyces umbrinus TaxID=67370 RepID=UPI00340D404D
MEAGASRTLLRLTYEGTLRMVEPYSLHFKRRKDGVAQEYLYVYDRTGGRSGPGIKGLLNYKINNVEVTEEKFDPRYEIELAKAGEFADRTTFGGTFRVNRTALRPGGSSRTRHWSSCVTAHPLGAAPGRSCGRGAPRWPAL